MERSENRLATKYSDRDVDKIVVEAKIDDSLKGVDTVGASKDYSSESSRSSMHGERTEEEEVYEVYILTELWVRCDQI